MYKVIGEFLGFLAFLIPLCIVVWKQWRLQNQLISMHGTLCRMAFNQRKLFKLAQILQDSNEVGPIIRYRLKEGAQFRRHQDDELTLAYLPAEIRRKRDAYITRVGADFVWFQAAEEGGKPDMNAPDIQMDILTFRTVYLVPSMMID